jgi:hypothetical protein
MKYGLLSHKNRVLLRKYQLMQPTYPTVTSARSCNNVGHLFWFTILAQHETNEVILYIHSVHKHWGNTFHRQNYKMRLKQRSLNWINSMQVKKIPFTNVFFSWESEWSIIIFSKYFKIQFAWPTFQKRSWTVMSIMSTHRKNTNVWRIPSMETYLTSIMIRKKRH